MEELNGQQQKFVSEYLKNNNATLAAKLAGYKESYSSNLMRNPKVKAAIKEGQKRLQKKAEITQEKVLKEYAVIAFANLEETDDEGKNIISAAAKLKALDALAKHLGLFTEKIEISTDTGNQIAAGFARVSHLKSVG